MSQLPWDKLPVFVKTRLYNLGDPRVPEDYVPTIQRASLVVTVELSRMTALSEKDLWSVLWAGWHASGMKTKQVTFLMNGNRVGTMDVPTAPRQVKDKVTRISLRKKKEVKATPPPPPSFARQSEDGIIIETRCEHCFKLVSPRSYRGFHGPKCFRAP